MARVIRSAILCVLVLCFSQTLAESKSRTNGGTNVFRQISQGRQLNKKELCDLLCSESEWCPTTCPEHTLSLTAFKRGNHPFDPTLGELSFEDYMFLRLFGRNF